MRMTQIGRSVLVLCCVLVRSGYAGQTSVHPPQDLGMSPDKLTEAKSTGFHQLTAGTHRFRSDLDA